jgi:transcriptional regulator with XRE-family HTH domain
MGSLSARQYLGAELRRLRKATGESGPEVAAQLGPGWVQSKISRIENARIGVTVADLAVLLQFYGAGPELQAELLSLAAAADAVAGTWVVRASGTPWRQIEVGAIEQRLTRLRHYEAMVVPGLLQAPRYTEALVRAGGFEHPEALVAARQRRQQVLLGPQAPRYDVVLDARALLYRPGDDDVAAAELDHLVESARLPAVQLCVVPLQAGAATLSMTPFMVFDFRRPSAPPVVLVETHEVDLYHVGPADVAAYADRFTRLQGDALDPAASLDYLRYLRGDLVTISLSEADVPAPRRSAVG